MKITQAIASIYMKFSKWTFVHEEIPPRVVAIGAPHTSNWDGWLMVMAFWKIGRPVKFLVKDNLTRIPVVGHIVRVEPSESGLYRTAWIKSAADLGKLEYGFVAATETDLANARRAAETQPALDDRVAEDEWP